MVFGHLTDTFRYSDDGELRGVIGIHVDDFLIGLADGEMGEK